PSGRTPSRPPVAAFCAGGRKFGVSGGYLCAAAAARSGTEAGSNHVPAGRAAIYLAGVEGAWPMAIIQMQQLSVPGRLTNLDLSLAANQVIGLIGPNGAGKSTLLQVLAGLLKYRGQVALDHQPLAQLKPPQPARRLGSGPQEQHSGGPWRAADLVPLGRRPWGGQDEQAIAAAIDGTGIRPLLAKPVHHLSGGPQARVWLARVLAGQPRV